MKALTFDVIEQLQKSAGIVSSEEASAEEKVKALDLILSYVDDIDTANDFCKIGGLFILLPCLESTIPDIREKAALLVAEMAQNNPYCQKELLDGGVLPKLMNMLNESDTEIAGIRAISCLVRGYEPSLKKFISIGGIKCLIGFLQSNNKKLVTRVAFFLDSLCIEHQEIQKELYELKAFETIIPLIQPKFEYDECLEKLLSLLCTLLQNFDGIREPANSAIKHSLKQSLEQIIQKTGDKPECEETIECSNKILMQLNENP